MSTEIVLAFPTRLWWLLWPKVIYFYLEFDKKKKVRSIYLRKPYWRFLHVYDDYFAQKVVYFYLEFYKQMFIINPIEGLKLGVTILPYLQIFHPEMLLLVYLHIILLESSRLTHDLANVSTSILPVELYYLPCTHS